MTQKRRVLIILWHWSALQKNEKKQDKIATTDNDTDVIIRLEETVDNNSKALVNAVSTIIEQHKVDSDITVLLHNKFLKNADEEVKSLKNEYKKNRFYFFGYQEGFIHYDATTDTGLLNASTGFADGEIYIQELLDGSKKRVRRSVMLNGKVQQKYFDSAWLYYQYEPKRKLFELQEDLITYLLGYNIDKDQQPEKLEEAVKHKAISTRLIKIKNKDQWQKRLQALFPNKERTSFVWEDYQKLCHFIDTEPFQSNYEYLRKLREKFANLITQIPGKIYT